MFFIATGFLFIGEAFYNPALIAPLALQEMRRALWFIFKGFDSAALARLPQVQ